MYSDVNGNLKNNDGTPYTGGIGITGSVYDDFNCYNKRCCNCNNAKWSEMTKAEKIFTTIFVVAIFSAMLYGALTMI